MKQWLCFLKEELTMFYRSRILTMIVIISLVFSVAMAIFDGIDPSNYLYVSAFVVPVVLFAVSMELHKSPDPDCPYTIKQQTLYKISVKVVASLLIQLIPFLFYCLVFVLALHVHINYFLLLLAYLLASTMHVLIGISLAIISRKDHILTFAYIVYLVAFSSLPILYSNGMVPISFQYYLVYSPAFLSSVLFDNILSGAMYSSVWFILICISLLVAYSILLIRFVIIPFFHHFFENGEVAE